MKRFVGALETVSPDAMSAFDEFSHLRVVEWVNRPEDVKMQYKENDNALLEFLNTAPLSKNTIKNPVVRYTVDGALATYTVLTAAIDATPGASIVISLEDSSILAAGHTFFVVSTGEEIYVESRDATANTVTCTRGKFGGGSFAAAIGSEIRVGAPVVGEFGSMKDAYSSYPGDPSYNYITLNGLKFTISKMQAVAAMTGEWGTLDKLLMDTKYQVETQVQTAMLFQHRHTEYDSTEHQIYRGHGLIPQLSGNVLDLGNAGTNFLWENINDFVNPMFASELSSDSKEVFAGHNLWADALTTARQMNAMEKDEIGISDLTGARQFVMYTNEGKRVVWNRVGGMDGELARLGLVLDASNIGGSQYDGLGPQWFFDIQDPDQVLIKTHAYMTSWEVHVYDRTTMGLIRGGTNPLIV